MSLKWMVILLLVPCNLLAQETYVSGKVIDSLSHEPLAFVNIVYNQTGQGVVTNLEGVFKIPKANKVQFLKLRYVGYRTKTMHSFKGDQIIMMNPEPTGIDEVVVYPSVNPAHRIIHLASENRMKNNPERSGPFSYISYDKMVFGIEPDSAMVDSSERKTLPDTLIYGMDQKGRIDMQRFVDKQYLFMMESISSRKFLAPGKNKEEIIASKVSGISQPTFMVMARQFQSFSFYENFITIADRQFVNPISSGSTDKYFFLIEDTTYTETADTVFIISFRPMKGKNFDGMKGVLYINSNGYAVQNVLAEAYEQKNDIIRISIQQQYDYVDGRRWFPVLLSTTMRFNPARFGYNNAPVNIMGTGKTYIVNVNFNPAIDPSEFSDVEIAVDPNAHRQSDEVWNKYRSDSLNVRELETYRVIDSLGKAEHLDRTVVSFETLLTGYLPGRYWSFDIRRFVDYNSYEGWRLGAGGKTTPLFSKRFTLAAYMAYGFRDDKLKYSGSFTLHAWPKNELDFSFLYRDDVKESGGIKFNESWNLTGSAFIREYMVEEMDRTKEYELSVGWRSFKYLTLKVYYSLGIINPAGDYRFKMNEESPSVMLTGYKIAETGIRLKYAWKETFMKSPRGNKFSMGTRYPVLYLNVSRGMHAQDGNFTYWRTEMKITKTFKTKSLGETRIAILGGLVSGIVPYSKLYAGQGSYKPFAVETEQSFGTMQFNEFLSDRFAAVFIKQDFGKLLFRPRGKFQPEIAMVHQFGIGDLSNPGRHVNIGNRTMEKGYFESGLLLNNLLHIQLFRYGAGFMYRYGPYAFPETIDNFAFKLTIQFNL